AGQEERVVALEAVEARYDVDKQRRVGVTEVRGGVDVEDRRRRVVGAPLRVPRFRGRLCGAKRFYPVIHRRDIDLRLFGLLEHDAVPWRAITHRPAPPGDVHMSDAFRGPRAKKQGRPLSCRAPRAVLSVCSARHRALLHHAPRHLTRSISAWVVSTWPLLQPAGTSQPSGPHWTVSSAPSSVCSGAGCGPSCLSAARKNSAGWAPDTPCVSSNTKNGTPFTPYALALAKSVSTASA